MGMSLQQFIRLHLEQNARFRVGRQSTISLFICIHFKTIFANLLIISPLLFSADPYTAPAVREVICKFIKATLSDAEMYESEQRVPVAQVR